MAQLLKLIVLMCVFLLAVGYLVPDSGLEPKRQGVIQNSFTGGQNDRDRPGSLQGTEAVTIKNAIIEDNGVLKKRDGLTVLGDDLGSNACLGAALYTHSTEGDTHLSCFNTTVYRLAGSTWTSVAGSFTAGKDMFFVIANDLAFMANGTDRIRYYNRATGTVTTFGSAATEPPLSKVGYWVKERMFWVDEANPSRIRYSNTGDPLVLPAVNDIPINEDDGQRIIQMQAFKNDLLIFKERSIWTLDMTGADPLTNWKVSSVDTNYGTKSPRTVRQMTNDVVFLDQFGKVRSLIRTQLDSLQTGTVPYSDTVRETLNDINISSIAKAAAEAWEDRYHLAFPTGSSTTNNDVLVYNARQKSWNHWTGWNISCWDKWIISGVYYLIGGEASADSKVYQCLTGDSDNGTDIDFDVITREFTMDWAGEKQWELAEVFCDATGVGNLAISAQFDFNGWQSLGNLNMAGDAPLLPQTLPFDLGNETIARAKFDLERYGRSRGVQFRFRNNATDNVTLNEITIFANLLSPRR